MCDHKQVTQDMFRVKEGSKSPSVLLMPLQIARWPNNPVQEDSPTSETAPISKSIMYGEYFVQSDCKKAITGLSMLLMCMAV
jgi:hypothetical protein